MGPADCVLDYDSLTLPSGKVLSIVVGTIGLGMDGEISTGCDMPLPTQELAPEDRRALCRWMSERWRRAALMEGQL